MNVHNLVINGVRINTVVFSLVLTSIMIVYTIIIPYLYRRNIAFKRFLDSKGVILPKNYQIISIVLVFVITSIIPDGKRAELLEFGAVFIFLLIVFYPMNEEIFNKEFPVKK